MEKKNLLIVIVIIILVVAIVGTVLILRKDKNEYDNKEIVVFSYRYGDSSTGHTNYLISVENGKTYISKIYNNSEIMRKEIEQSTLRDISKIVTENKIYKWNGFDKVDQGTRRRCN